MLESPGTFPTVVAVSHAYREDTEAHVGQSDPVFSNCQDLGVGFCAEVGETSHDVTHQSI